MKEDVVLRWLKKADNDLKAVEYLLDAADAPLDIICFHCQQAVEKFLNAYLTWADIRVKKTHDLESILNLCIEENKEFGVLDKDKISELTLYAVTINILKNILNPLLKRRKNFMKLHLK